jgi:protease I
MRLQEEGANVVVVAIRAGETHASKSGGLEAIADLGAGEVDAGQLDAVVVPGGWAPDKSRRYPAVTGLAREFYRVKKVVAD